MHRAYKIDLRLSKEDESIKVPTRTLAYSRLSESRIASFINESDSFVTYEVLFRRACTCKSDVPIKVNWVGKHHRPGPTTTSGWNCAAKRNVNCSLSL